MTDTSLVWICVCGDGNARSETHCLSCGEKQPPYVRLEEIQDNTPLGLELMERHSKKAAKRAKSPKKGQKRASKQRGKKIEYDGHTFDSTIEFQRYLHLKECWNNGQIEQLQVHPTFTLAPSVKLPVTFETKTQAAITYTPDFAYRVGAIWVYEDTKGAYGHSKKNVANGKAGKPIVTEAARLRHKLFIAKLASEGNDFHFQLVTVATLPVRVQNEAVLGKVKAA